MKDTRAVRQEVQDQIVAAARKGQQRVASTVKTVTATAQMIRPQLPSLPKPNLSNLPKPDLSKLPKPDLSKLPRPTFDTLPRPTLNGTAHRVASQLRERTPVIVAKLPSRDLIRSGAAEFAGLLRSDLRQAADRVREAAEPFARQAGEALVQAAGRVRRIDATATLNGTKEKASEDKPAELADTAEAADTAKAAPKASAKAAPKAKPAKAATAATRPTATAKSAKAQGKAKSTTK
jgi:hypothetical protein